MGNKIGKCTHVDENHTRPQGLYQHRNIDHKKLRKLILDAKLAPCYLGEEEPAFDLEECPICFLYYPSLNRSRCCVKGICTECFLQMKPPNSTRPTQCPFCKTGNYAVEYRGMRTKEEKGIEQFEEQKVIEAQIRMRQQQLQDEEEMRQKKQEDNSSCETNNTISVPSSTTKADEVISSEVSCSMPLDRKSSHTRHSREDNFDWDLEEIMVMEAIWLSIQEQSSRRNPAGSSSSFRLPPSSISLCSALPTVSAEGSNSGGLASAVAALAEHQYMNGGSASTTSTTAPVFNRLRHMTNITNSEESETRSYPPERRIEFPQLRPDWDMPDRIRRISRDDVGWTLDYGSEIAEAGTSYSSSEYGVHASGVAALSLTEGVNTSSDVIPESFEEQMMLAMAVSLADARARAISQWLR